MKNILVTLLYLFLVQSIISQNKIQEGNGHPFVCNDYTQGKVFMVDVNGKITWEYPAKDAMISGFC